MQRWWLRDFPTNRQILRVSGAPDPGLPQQQAVDQVPFGLHCHLQGIHSTLGWHTNRCVCVNCQRHCVNHGLECISFSFWLVSLAQGHSTSAPPAMLSVGFSGCGGTLSTSTGSFSSPNYPLPYHPNAECYWHIKVSGGSRIHLEFVDFHLESSSSCQFDYLAVSSESLPLCLCL